MFVSFYLPLSYWGEKKQRSGINIEQKSYFKLNKTRQCFHSLFIHQKKLLEKWAKRIEKWDMCIIHSAQKATLGCIWRIKRAKPGVPAFVMNILWYLTDNLTISFCAEFALLFLMDFFSVYSRFRRISPQNQRHHQQTINLRGICSLP
jgi:hypothetical protein